MIYWYTYGPEYFKGDSFSQDPEAVKLTSKAAHLLGKAEDALYAARWIRPAEIAVVQPETTQRWMDLSGDPPHLVAAWENAKWVYTALQHAHLPVDPIDEGILETADLSHWKAIYVSGSHLRRKAAEALARYVRDGGTLYTSGWGLVRDEADRPLELMEPVLGLRAARRQRCGGGCNSTMPAAWSLTTTPARAWPRCPRGPASMAADSLPGRLCPRSAVRSSIPPAGPKSCASATVRLRWSAIPTARDKPTWLVSSPGSNIAPPCRQ